MGHPAFLLARYAAHTHGSSPPHGGWLWGLCGSLTTPFPASRFRKHPSIQVSLPILDFGGEFLEENKHVQVL